MAGCLVEERAYGIGFTDFYYGDDDVVFFEPDTGPVEVREFESEREAQAGEILESTPSDSSTQSRE